jgi:Domain of unknown function (DUF6265)
MKYIFTMAAALLVFTASAQQTPAPIPFKQLAGTWIMTTKKGNLMAEVWQKNGDKSMKGKSYMVKGTDTTVLETVDWLKEGDDMFYIPVAAGQNDDKPVKFKLTSFNGNVYTFENPAHDFPKRIVYDFSSLEELHAYIDDGTDKKRQHYHYKRKP